MEMTPWTLMDDGSGLVGTSVRFPRPRLTIGPPSSSSLGALGVFPDASVVALLAGTHGRCGATSAVRLLGRHGTELARIVCDAVAVALTECTFVVEFWGTSFQHRGGWGRQMCFSASPLCGITSGITKLTGLHFAQQRTPRNCAQNSLWDVSFNDRDWEEAPPVEIWITSKRARECKIVPLDDSRSLVARFIEFDPGDPDLLLLITSKKSDPTRVVFMMIDVAKTLSSERLAIMHQTGDFMWPFHRGLFHIESTLVMRSSQRGHRLFVSQIQWDSTFQVIESLEDRRTVKTISLTQESMYVLSRSGQRLFVFEHESSGWCYQIRDCTEASSKQVKKVHVGALYSRLGPVESGFLFQPFSPNHIDDRVEVLELLSGVRVLSIDVVGAKITSVTAVRIHDR
ncbi:hypothetical protein Pelo_17779 [Pelomyxa schiedti]|nr:hypothetical protein Pelo_17779 [Pelomyxa schiedti]